MDIVSLAYLTEVMYQYGIYTYTAGHVRNTSCYVICVVRDVEGVLTLTSRLVPAALAYRILKNS